jgi:SAM-dependent methyltransferase
MSNRSSVRAGLLRRIYHRLPTPPSTNFCVPGYDHPDPFAGLDPAALIYDVGSKRVQEYGRWRLPPDARVVRIDIDPAAAPDIVADAHDLNLIADGSGDCVVSVCVIEHCERPHVVMEEFYRILKPGGRLFIGVPFMFPYHADPQDHWRVSNTGIDHLCRQFQKTGSGFIRGPASCITHFNIHFLALLFSFNSRVLYGILVDLFKWLLFWMKYLDRLLIRHPMRHVIHGGVWFLGTKPQA